MPAIAMRKTTVAGLNATQRKMLRMVCEQLDLGDPVEYKTATDVRWYIFDDPRITLRDMAILGRFANMLATAPDVDTRAEVLAWIEANGVVWPRPQDIAAANPYQAVLTANGAPAALQAADSVPATLTPVEA